jgi:hypothetical protein
MSSRVDPNHFRKRFLNAIGDVFDAAAEAEAANIKMGRAMTRLDLIAGRSFAAAVHELATEPRRVCSACQNDFMESETGRDVCVACAKEHNRGDSVGGA